MKNFEILNKVQSFLIDFANSNGINLHAEFKSVEEFKMFVVAITIKTLVEAGVEMQKAFDATLGDGEYDKLANKVWEMANKA
jgi:hypothetical protein